MTDEKLNEIRNALMEIVDKHIMPNNGIEKFNLAKELKNRLTSESHIQIQVGEALSLLCVNAFLPTKSDIRKILDEISKVCDCKKFDDVVYLDSEEGRWISLMGNVQEESDEDRSFREFVLQLMPNYQNEFYSWEAPKSFTSDDDTLAPRN